MAFKKGGGGQWKHNVRAAEAVPSFGDPNIFKREKCFIFSFQFSTIFYFISHRIKVYL